MATLLLVHTYNRWILKTLRIILIHELPFNNIAVSLVVEGTIIILIAHRINVSYCIVLFVIDAIIMVF